MVCSVLCKFCVIFVLFCYSRTAASVVFYLAVLFRFYHLLVVCLIYDDDGDDDDDEMCHTHQWYMLLK